MPNSTPSTLGLKKTFGFGDRLGLAGPGFIAAVRKSAFTPILAQQSIRELTRTKRSPQEVLDAARQAVASTDYEGPWGADADHIKTTEDAERMVAAGYTFFTIDPSAYVNNAADSMNEVKLEAALAEASAGLPPEITAPEVSTYAGKGFEARDTTYKFNRENALRAAVKYGRAIAHCEVMARCIRTAAGDRPVELEVSIDETDSTTSPLDHVYVALEMRRRSIAPVSVAPRFVGGFEKGVDYKGDLKLFEHDLAAHVAIAEAFGPYKVSIHSGSDKFSIYPIIGRLCGDHLHVKTAGTNYLEALRVVCRTKTQLFSEIAQFSMQRFSQDKASYHISVTDDEVAALRLEQDRNWLERVFLDEDKGRQILHVTFGSVLTAGRTANGQLFKEGIMEALAANEDLHKELVSTHLGRHLSALEQG